MALAAAVLTAAIALAPRPALAAPSPRFSKGLGDAAFGMDPGSFAYGQLGAGLCPAPMTCSPLPAGQLCRCTGGRFQGDPAEAELTFARGKTGLELAQIVIIVPPTGDFDGWRKRIEATLFADAEDRSRPFAIPSGSGGPGLQGTAYDSWYDLGLLAVARIARADDGSWRVVDRQVPMSLKAEGQQLPENPGELSEHAAPTIPVKVPLPATHWVGYQVTGIGSFTHHRLDSAPAPSAPAASLDDEGRIVPGGTLAAVQLSDRTAWMYEVGYLTGFLGGDATRSKYTLVPLGLGGRILAFNPATSVRPYVGWHLGISNIRMRVLDHPNPEDGWSPYGALELGVQVFSMPSLGLAAGVRYDLAGSTHFTQAPNLNPSGFTFNLALFFGGGVNTAAVMSGAEYARRRDEDVPGEIHALVASMEGHWKPTGRLLPEGSVVEVELPPGAYRLTPGPNIRLHAGGGEGDPSGNAESDAQVVSEGDKVYAFVHHKSRVGAFVEGVGPGDRFILLEELDAAEWQPQGPPVPATPAR